ncbi:MAG: helix-turn-helix transcriptional regulator [Lachnospiraceae bacterium]|nr:helix-turn-helix transcriptional regulator [Lachnospiraceae bacterium]
MNEEKTAKLIRDARKQREMTQKDLASRIGVSVQAVSKWENARGFPEISLLEPLSKELGLSVAELVTGDCEEAQPEAALKDVIDESVRQTKKKTAALKLAFAILILGVILGIVWWSTPKRFLKNVDPEDVHLIYIFDGNTGKEFNLSDTAEIRFFITSVSGMELYKTRFGVSYGSAFRVTVFVRRKEPWKSILISEKQLPTFVISGSNALKQGLVLWSGIDGGLPYDWLTEMEELYGAPMAPKY